MTNPTLIDQARLREALEEVMEWIKNWSPDFLMDEEWPATEAKCRQALTETAASPGSGDGWQPIETAPKGVPTADVGCRGRSEWFQGLRKNGEVVEICRRPWPQDDSWADRDEGYYLPNEFTHWRPITPPSKEGDE